MDMYNRLVNRKRRILEEDMNMTITIINQLCNVDSKEELDKILKGIETFLRKKRR